MNRNPKIVIAGAGSIGCYIGGLLKNAGHDVSFLGRQRIADELARDGLLLSDYSGSFVEIAKRDIDFHTDPKILNSADIILVSVKGGATEDIAHLIRDNTSKPAVVVSLQNGIRNGTTLKSLLKNHDVRSGMVSFNVVRTGEGRFHQGTSGSLVIGSGDPDIAKILESEKLELESSPHMSEILWGKLLLNLNNALNALSGIPLLEQISDREWRKIMAAQIEEGLTVFKAAGIKPNPPIPAPASSLPIILRLPDFLFKRIAKQMLSIDPQARSSMWEDLQAGRKTEISDLQGEIIRLGETHNISTPTNEKVLARVKQSEADELGSPKLKPNEL